VGDELVIRLAENPTTGHVWELQQAGEGTLRIADNRFEAGSPEGGLPAPGAAGYRVVRLVGERPGTVHLQAVERRPWEPPEKALQTRAFTIVVQ
jgi:predicted secreted protein